METNIAKTIKITDALLVVKKLPDVLNGKNSIKKIKKKGMILLSKVIKSKYEMLIFLVKILRKNINRKIKTILKPTIPKSVKISK